MLKTGRGPNVLTVPSGAAFLERLAGALRDGTLFPGIGDAANPFALADVLVLVPTRRACRAFADALVQQAAAGPSILPRIRALGDIDVADLAFDPDLVPDFPADSAATDALGPAIGTLDRQLLLTRLVERWGASAAASVLELAEDEAPLIPGSPAMAARLAAELARLIDAMETEGIDFARLGEVVPDGFARYWQIALAFLEIVSETWPRILAERGLVSPAARRNALIEAEAARLARIRPTTPIIAAGSTGSIPATARLLGVIAGLPNGAVILPGLDRDCDDGDWAEILTTPSHPQHGMARLLAGMGAERKHVRPLGAAPQSAASRARTRLSAAALRPAERTATWAAEASAATSDLADALSGLTYVCARTVEEEALAIALMMREAAEDPKRTAALISPDRGLARRVQAELARWDIAVDDSAGTPLALTAPGLFARHTAALVADGLEPVLLLSLLKHPLARLGMAPETLRRAARVLEIAVLRGPRPEPSVDGLKRAVEAARAAIEKGEEKDAARRRLSAADWAVAERLLAQLAAAMGRIDLAAGDVQAARFVEAHRTLCEAFAADQTGSTQTLFEQPAGEALAALFDALAGGIDPGWTIHRSDYPGLFAALAAGRPVRPQRPAHPRLHILGLLEARLLRFDLVILGGLNEGTWPADTRTDPWLSRAMREKLGLPAPERRIGLAAHDFAQGFAAPEVVLTRAERVNGDPSVESRFLLRLDAVLQPAGGLKALQRTGEPWLKLARRLDDPGRWQPIPAPAPRPPVASRPRKLSVTEIETWIRDPYAIYAKHVLKLEPLDPLDEALDAADRGALVHDVLHRFFRDGGAADADLAFDRLRDIGRGLFAGLPDAPEVKAFWWRRFLRAAAWFARFHAEEAGTISRSFTELRGEIEVAGPAGPFRLSARADRIDVRADGTLAILDYKTGQVPSGSQVASGLSPQLSLEAAIALEGGFDEAGLPRASVSRLAYISLSGATPPGAVREIADKTPQDLAAEALEGLKRKVAGFDDPQTPYLSRPHPMFLSRFGPYDHLARVKEWSRQGDGSGE
ncbi:MAG: double-strand break repair protein AddB [Hyphomicrobiales bacterium]|nr:double-strand break repair protein AddB [Hyphomicrobiales bacterium]